VKRYQCTVGDKRGAFGDCMEQDRDGKWIRYSDHQKQVQELERQIAALKNKTQRETKQ